MQNKSRSRTDVQWVISSVSLAVTLGLWGLFAGHEKRGAGVVADAALTLPTDQPVVVTQPQMLAPGQVLLFGGTAPQPQVQQQVTVTQGRSKHRGGGGATTSTGSSKP
jgi:hypothetical protein